MDGSFEIDAATRIVRVVVTGKFDGETMFEIAGRLFTDPRYSPGMGTLFDARSLDMIDVTAIEMHGHVRRCVDFLTRHGYRGKTAWVAGSAFGYGMGRMYENIRELGLSSPIMVFREIAAAEDWIAR